MLKDLFKIKPRNFWIWFKDQWHRDRFFYNMFVSRNAWGAFSMNSHINQHTGQPKISYSLKSAKKSAEKMAQKRGVHFSYYKCLFCDGYHIGKNRENKIEGYDYNVKPENIKITHTTTPEVVVSNFTETKETCKEKNL